ncbi:MAG: RluA family pseudouridine synthase [Oscillospiraceae bacterium]|nr:RluA family pseudouridine synthase [Oscillospiraceae bacterium]
MRLDQTVAQQLNMTRARAQSLITDGHVLVNGLPAKKSAILNEGDVLTWQLPQPVELAAQPEDIPLDIRLEDDDLLVVNKPQGMVVHPAPGHSSGTLVNALLWHCNGKLSREPLWGLQNAQRSDGAPPQAVRPGIVHRIDKDTSGLLIVAKTDFAHQHLAAQIAAHTFTREYRAVVCGRLKEPVGTINLPIGRHPKDRKKMAIVQAGKPAVTHYEVLRELSDKFSELKLTLETGRTHQIRVHMAHMGRPVAGDPMYGVANKRLAGQCLHAERIAFTHPRTGETIDVQAAVPIWFENFLKSLGGIDIDQARDS